MAAPVGKDTIAVLDLVKQFGSPIRVSEIIELLPDIAPTIISSAVDSLVAWECVTKEMVRKVRGSGMERKVTFVKPIEERTKGRLETGVRGPKAELINLTTERDALLVEVEDLRAWKDQAIRRYPDLAVKPEVLAARNLVAETLHEAGDHLGGNEVMAGRRDSSPLMRVALKAMGGD